MDKKIELSEEVLTTVTQQTVGVVELSDDMLQMVAGGIPIGWTNSYSTCWRVMFHQICA
jgi:hypothetical protein